MRAAGHVFAYGSLARDLRGEPAVLRGARRAWGVAMDNRRVIPGYKVWLDPRDHSRPAVHVAFLDLVVAPVGARVHGMLVPVSAAQLRSADARERNYRRVDVTERLSDPPRRGRVWAYVGTAAGRARFGAGMAAGTAVVARAYLDAVRGVFSSAVPSPPAPVRPLERRDVPPPR